MKSWQRRLLGKACLPGWLGSVPSYLFKLFKLQETGSSVPLQFAQVGIQLSCLEEAEGVVVPLQSLWIISGLGGIMMCSLAQSCAAQAAVRLHDQC